MVTFAAYQYRDVLAEHGGPIKTLEITKCSGRDYQANAWLRDGLRPAPRRRSIYGTCDGTGTHRSPLIARFIAVSEALERWAHHEMASVTPGDGGFDIDPTSNGMAAFPSITCGPARRRALLEAVERASLFDWWEGRLAGERVQTRWKGVEAVRLENPFACGVTAITFHEIAPGWFSYGHAAAGDWRQACARAAVEMNRSALVLERYRRRAEEGKAPQVVEIGERRCLFFASAAGHQQFIEHLHRPAVASVPSWRIAFDAELKGPWSRYAKVWRVVIPPATGEFLAPNDRYFFW